MKLPRNIVHGECYGQLNRWQSGLIAGAPNDTNSRLIGVLPTLRTESLDSASAGLRSGALSSNPMLPFPG